MSLERSKKNSFRDNNPPKHKLRIKFSKMQTDQILSSYRNLPLIQQKKLSSTKSLALAPSNSAAVYEVKQNGLIKITKFHSKNDKKKYPELECQKRELKYFFKKKKPTIPLDVCLIKKYSSYSKLASYASIAEMHLPSNEEQAVLCNQNQRQRYIKSTKEIKLQQSQGIKVQNIDRIPLKKILNTHLSKTINPRNLKSEHSLEIQNQEKCLPIHRNKKYQKESVERLDSKNKILVKNPFIKLSKKHSNILQNMVCNAHLMQTLERQFRLSGIFQDKTNQNDISISGKSEIKRLIGYIKD